MSIALSSWKEIAAYLGKGVRTVQRWEHQFGLPVRRPSARSHVIFAIPEELDAWLKSHQQTAMRTAQPPVAVTRKRRMQQRELMTRLKSSYSRLEKNEQVLGKHMSRLIAIMQGRPSSPSLSSRSTTAKPGDSEKANSRTDAA